MATPIKYRISSVATKPTADSVKGAPLTSLEIDGNFRSLKDSVEALSASGGAALVGNVPAGGVAATTVQAAINELDSEKISFTRLDDSDGASLVGYTPAGTGAVATTVQAKLRESVSVKDFGAVGDGVTDDTSAIQAAINYASANSKSVFIPDGTFLLDKLTFVDPTGIYANRGQNIFGLLFAKSNVTIFGNGKNSVLKVAANQLTKTFTYTADVNSGTYQNYAMPGTKGFQVFAQHPSDSAVNNFALRDLMIDLNGYNNKVYPLNAFGNQSQCHAVYLKQGGNPVIERVRFVNAPGSQVIALDTGTTFATVKDNVFLNCGLLDGTNTNLDDHSTIYSMGSDARIVGNRLTQDVQWTQKGGTPIEVHGSATVTGNYISKYMAMGVVGGINLSGDFVIENNVGRSITALGYDLYTGNNSFTLKARIAYNDVELTKVALADTHPAYKYRSFIVSPFTNSNSGANEIDVCYNQIRTIGSVGWSTDLEDTYNAAFNLRLLSSVRIYKNSIIGFRGPVITLLEQKISSSVIFEGNTVVSCGRKHTYEVNNAAINYTNRDNVSYGDKLYALYSKQNTFTSCGYAAYLSFNCVAAGLLVVPVVVEVANDTSDSWMPPLVASADLGFVNTGASWHFRYACTGFFDATQNLKVLPDSSKEYAKACFGEITIKSGPAGSESLGRFSKIRGTVDWQYNFQKTADSAPTASEISPFGAKIGDTVQVVAASAGGNAGYYCTAAGSPGTWKAYGAISPPAYAEGTFTPVVAGGSTVGVGTYTTQVGKYTRIGNCVFFYINLAWTAHTGSGGTIIGGLPFNASNNYQAAYSIYSGLTVSAGKELGFQITANNSTITLLSMDPAGGAAGGVTLDTSVSTLIIQGHYFV